MDFLSGNVNPLANAISNLGKLAFMVELKKQKAMRDLGKDLYAAEHSQASTDLLNAKTEGQALQNSNISKLAGLFNPETFTDEQRSNLGAAAMLGTKSLNDALKASEVQQNMQFKKEQYDDGNAATRLSVALGKQVKPYDIENGYLLNNMTGGVSEIPGYTARQLTLKGPDKPYTMSQGYVINKATGEVQEIPGYTERQLTLKGPDKPYTMSQGYVINKATGEAKEIPGYGEHVQSTKVPSNPYGVSSGYVVNKKTGEVVPIPGYGEHVQSTRAPSNSYGMSSGYVINKKTGEVVPIPGYDEREIALKKALSDIRQVGKSSTNTSTKASTKSSTTKSDTIRQGELNQVFSKTMAVKDIYGNDQYKTVVDRDAQDDFIRFATNNGIPINRDTARLYRIGDTDKLLAMSRAQPKGDLVPTGEINNDSDTIPIPENILPKEPTVDDSEVDMEATPAMAMATSAKPSRLDFSRYPSPPPERYAGDQATLELLKGSTGEASRDGLSYDKKRKFEQLVSGIADPEKRQKVQMLQEKLNRGQISPENFAKALKEVMN